MQNSEQLALAQWILDRNLAWIAAADAKAGFVIAIDTAMLTGLAAAWTQAGETHTAWQILTSVACAICITLSLGATALAFRSRIDGPSASLIYFKRIADSQLPAYVAALGNATTETIIGDLAQQIHRNAEIARDKHWWAWRSTQFGFCGAFFLACAAVTLLR